VAKSKDILWVRKDVLGNSVSFFENTWLIHASKHTFDEVPVTTEHFYQAIVDPDHARRSLDPVIGHESCIFQKFFEVEQKTFFLPVIYDGVSISGDYDQGGKKGRVSTGYFQFGKMSGSIGDIFWSNPKLAPKKDEK
jgi:hypothetical protein